MYSLRIDGAYVGDHCSMLPVVIYHADFIEWYRYLKYKNHIAEPQPNGSKMKAQLDMHAQK